MQVFPLGGLYFYIFVFLVVEDYVVVNVPLPEVTTYVNLSLRISLVYAVRKSDCHQSRSHRRGNGLEHNRKGNCINYI